MANERVRGNDIGPTGRTVADNIARARKQQQITLSGLERRLTDEGRRITVSALSKIERGERRVDVDDLMAIAIALNVTPNSLLLPLDEPGVVVEVTGARGSLGQFWEWANAENTPFDRDDRAFLARSLPWWMDEPAPSLTWFGTLEFVMAVGSEPLRRTQAHDFAKRNREDVEWDRQPE